MILKFVKTILKKTKKRRKGNDVAVDIVQCECNNIKLYVSGRSSNCLFVLSRCASHAKAFVKPYFMVSNFLVFL